MELKTALSRAHKFTSADKEAGVLAGILLVPAVYDDTKPIQFVEGVPLPITPAYVQASDGVVTYRAYLDLDVFIPHVVVDGGALLRALSTLKKEPFVIERTGEQSAVVRSASGTLFQIVAHHGSAFPKDPAFPPSLHPFHDSRAMTRLLHITKKVEKTRPELLSLHAAGGWVETSDQMRTARMPVSLPIADGRLIHRDLWTHWPRSPQMVRFAVHEDVAFVYVDEELRWGPATTDEKFYDLRAQFPEAHHGYKAKCPRISLMQGTKFATAASPFDGVELTFADGMLHVCGLDGDGQPASKHVLEAKGATDPVRVVVKGRLLWESLHAQDGDEIVVGYAAPDQPLRLEAEGGYCEALWPMVPQEPS